MQLEGRQSSHLSSDDIAADRAPSMMNNLVQCQTMQLAILQAL